MATPEPRLSTLQQERSRETRRKLVKSADRLWRTKGFEETTVGDICADAGVSKGTFYFYFPHKEDLLIELGLRTAAQVAAETQLVDDERDTEQVLHDLIVHIVKRVEDTPVKLLEHTLIELYRLIGHWSEVRAGPADFRVNFTSVFSRAVDRGELPAETDVEEVSAILTAVVMAGMLSWAQGRTGEPSLEEVLSRRAALVFRGARSLGD